MAFTQRNMAAGMSSAKPKYEKLEKGERKAVRESGAKKLARQQGVTTNIYSGERGGLVGSQQVGGGSVTTPILRNKTTEKASFSPTKDSESKLKSYNTQSSINQADFGKTRLGSRIIKKAAKATEKGKFEGGAKEVNATIASKRTTKVDKKYNKEEGTIYRPSQKMKNEIKSTSEAEKKKQKYDEKRQRSQDKIKRVSSRS